MSMWKSVPGEKCEPAGRRWEALPGETFLKRQFPTGVRVRCGNQETTFTGHFRPGSGAPSGDVVSGTGPILDGY